MSRPPARLGILLSGRGSNFLALHRAIEDGRLPAEIALVASNVPEAPGIHRARELGLPTFTLSHRGMKRREHDRAMVEEIQRAGAQWVCLAGYMRLLSPVFVEAFPQRMLNIHPSLLPAFPGLDAQKQAWEHGVKVAGCTVHLVDEGLDSGPIILQRSVDIDGLGSPQEVAECILAEEHVAYPEALGRLLSVPWRVEGRRVLFE